MDEWEKEDAEADRKAKEKAANEKRQAEAKRDREQAQDDRETAKRSKEHDEGLAKTTEVLGNDFIGQAEDRQLEIQQMPENGKLYRKQKVAAQARFRAEVQAEVARQLAAQGIEGGQAAEAANEFGDFIGRDIQRQKDFIREKNAGSFRAGSSPDVASGDSGQPSQPG